MVIVGVCISTICGFSLKQSQSQSNFSKIMVYKEIGRFVILLYDRIVLLVFVIINLEYNAIGFRGVPLNYKVNLRPFVFIMETTSGIVYRYNIL